MVEKNTVAALGVYLRNLHGQQYGAYKSIQGEWMGGDVDVCIDRVQGDPFATPSVVRLRLHNAGYSADDLRPGPSRTATCDLLAREFAAAVASSAKNEVAPDIDNYQGYNEYRGRGYGRGFRGGRGRGRGRVGVRPNLDSGSGKSGKVEVNSGGAEILRRAACEVANGELEFRIRVGLPANGRRIQGRAAMVLLSQRLPAAANAMREKSICREKLSRWQHSTLTHELISSQLKQRGLVAFIANGATLPRSSGVTSQPLSGATSFESPASLKVTFKDSDGVSIEGMGIKRGITILTGPGFHGKSTVLQALQVGCYPHIPGDGRELVITDPTAVKVRSEDGRCITCVNVQPFIGGNLPGGKDTLRFSTEDASGSTSLAASIQESLEAEASTLLLDEDTCATNLLVRDARMQELVKVDAIVPLVDRITQLRDGLEVSVIAVIGGCGDYLDVADTTLAMKEYKIYDVSEDAQTVVRKMPSGRKPADKCLAWTQEERTILTRSVASNGRKSGGKARGLRDLIYGDEELALDGLEQLVDPSQVRFMGALMEWIGNRNGGQETLRAIAKKAIEESNQRGIYCTGNMPEMAQVRMQDLIAVINRLRSLRLS